MCDRWGWRKEEQVGGMVELDTQEYITLFKDMLCFGIQRITLTGGEPTLRPDFLDLTEQALKLGLTVSVVSNGEILAGMSEKLAAIAGVISPQFIVAVSLLGLHEVHDKHCGRDGSFERAILALQSLLAHQILADVFFTVLPGNVHQLVEVCHVLRSLGIPWVRFGVLHGYGDLAFTDQDMNILQEQFCQLQKMQQEKDSQFSLSYQWYIFKMIQQGTMTLKDFQNHVPARLLLEEPQYCPYINRLLFMNPYGYIHPCHFAEFSNQDYAQYQSQRKDYIMGNVRQQTLQQIWDGLAYTKFRQRTLPIQPDDHELKSVCNQCIYLCQNWAGKKAKKKH